MAARYPEAVAITRIDTLLGPDHIAGIESLPMGEIRARRNETQEAADVLSYLRRIVQGRLDLVYAELEHRAGGERGDLHETVEQLKRGEIMSEHGRPSGFGRLPLNFGPAEADGWITQELDQILDADRAGRLSALSDADLRSTADGLGDMERKVSDQRNKLHERHDVFQAEVVRRYRSGEANVDSLLR